jgi:predicted GIY-YIG superfamily endonuclease
MKQCTKCKQELALEMFNKCKSTKDGLQFHCRECVKNHYRENPEYTKNYIQSKKKAYYTVYLLVDENYVGQTSNPTVRMWQHKSKSNYNTGNWIVLGKFDTRQEALQYEAELHSQGYNGRRTPKKQRESQLFF